jgi:putative serine/threonine protein kinase
LNNSIALDKLLDSTYKQILCYPKYNEQEAIQRLHELEKLSIERLYFEGPHIIQGFNILGKGHVGLVLLSKREKEKVAVKIRRIDSDRKDMTHEAKMLALANSVDVGPCLLEYSPNFIVMELIRGMYLREWIQECKPKPHDLKNVLRNLLIKTRHLDSIGLDHGELTVVKRHFVITNNGPRIIDFESASINRRTKNVNSAVQSFFLNYGFSQIIKDIITLPNTSLLLDALKRYKLNLNEENFLKIINISRLSEEGLTSRAH